MNLEAGLYVVATPIGNLGDITERAKTVLSLVDAIAAEDTRHTLNLLNALEIKKPLVALHTHNEKQQAANLVERIQSGQAIALVSDAGTPLISDPGGYLVREAHTGRVPVIPIPGPSALITALCASGFASARFNFEGFLPAKSSSKYQYLTELKSCQRTMVFYEAPHRLVETIEMMAEIFGGERFATLARELTKKFETIRVDTLQGLQEAILQDPNQQKGEIVLVVAGAPENSASQLDENSLLVLETLLEACSLKKAVQLTAQVTGLPKKLVYQTALTLKKKN